MCVVVQTRGPSIEEFEAWGLQIQSQFGPHSVSPVWMI